MVLSSWNREVGMGPIGKESSFSTVTSSLHVVSANARRNISSGLMFPLSFDKTLTVLIRDGMGIIQSLDVKKFSNFGDLAIFYLKHLSMLFQSAETIVDFFDSEGIPGDENKYNNNTNVKGYRGMRTSSTIILM
jgi:hypothetical protein